MKSNQLYSNLMKHTYYRLGLQLALWPLVQLASGQGLTLTWLAPTRNARSAPQTTNVGLTFNQELSNGWLCSGHPGKNKKCNRKPHQTNVIIEAKRKSIKKTKSFE